MSEKNNRIDLSDLKTYAIDDKYAEEIDDAISLEKVDNRFRLWIHISDPSSIIPSNSDIDKKAFAKGSTLYLVSGTIHMLPISILEDLAGFKSQRKSNSLSVCIELSQEGEITKSHIIKSIIKPNYKLTYDEAQELIELAPQEEIDLFELSKLMNLRREFRRKKGAIIINQLQGRFTESIVNPKLTIQEKTDSRILVEEMMILMGNVIANYGVRNDIPLIYRVQDISPIPQNLDNIDLSVYESYLKRKLKKARLSSKPMQHFTLGLDNYVQATSPIRRYSDFLVHRQIINFLDGKKIISRLDMANYITYLESKTEESNQRIREEQKECQSSWFINYADKIWKAYFILKLKKTEENVLLRFSELEQDIACKINRSKTYELGECLHIKFSRIDSHDKVLTFNHC